MVEEERQRRHLLRIIDANRNRALEGLRVVEEHARFVLAAEDLARRTKDMRLRIHLCLERAGLTDLALHRDVFSDPLRPSPEEEQKEEAHRVLRKTSEDVARANLSRVKEALRALEEYARPLAHASSREIELIRYDAYALERDLETASRGRALLRDRPVYVLLEEKQGRHPLEAMARSAIAGGARILQLRDKLSSGRELLSKARELVSICESADALVIVNDRPDIAALSGADGVHLGQEDIPAADARKLLGPSALVGASAHDGPELERSLASPIDYLGIGTVFPSPTKPELGSSGLERLRELAARATVPVYAIGGVTRENAASTVEAGARGVAVSSSVLDAQSIEEAVRELVCVVTEARAKQEKPR
ncbi:thiamine phosphate synthase [bacterium]|nr:thiamine phosphate synthase [bacterium]